MSYTPLSIYRRLPSAKQRTRRLLVLAAFLGYPLLQVGYATLVAPGRLSNVVWAPVAIVLFSATLVGLFGIYGYARGRADMGTDLDERERHVRDQAWIVAYGMLSVAATAVLGLLAIVVTFGGPVTLDMGVLGPWFIAFGLYLPTLPSAALTWMEPDPPAEFDEGASRGDR